MLKRIALALTALIVVAGTLPALAVDPTPAQAPLRVLATRTVRAGRHSLGLFLFLVGAAVVVWLVLRWRAAKLGYLDDGGRYPSGGQPRPYGPAGYPGGYMPGGPGIMGSVAAGVPLGAGVAPPVEVPPVPDPDAGTGSGATSGGTGGGGERT